ncbi:glycerol channel [Dimargaris xerosporica]|nr:glycerol channel [Dimargaris xerosporica]
MAQSNPVITTGSALPPPLASPNRVQPGPSTETAGQTSVDISADALQNWKPGDPSVPVPHGSVRRPTQAEWLAHRHTSLAHQSFMVLQKQHWWRQFRYHFREYLAELFGTYTMTLFGLGVIITSTLNEAAVNQKWLLIGLGWGLAIMLALFVSQGVSGGHLNPAITITLAIWRRFPWRKVPGYILCQLLGAFIAAACLHLLFLQSLNAFADFQRDVTGPHATASLFVTFPTAAINKATAFLSEGLATAFLTIGVFAVTDRHNVPPVGWGPLALGLIVTVQLFSLTFQTGGALNPARDLGPRLYLLAAGWTVEVFQAEGYYFFVPMFAPIIGAVVGGFAYDLFIISSPRKVY